MTDSDQVQQRLEAEKARLEGLRGDVDADGARERDEQGDLSALSAVDQHPADIGTETFNRERDLSLLEQIEAELADVEHALGRLRDGTYGTCEACGKPIEPDRLEVQPAARFCLADQAAAEREGRSAGG